MNLSMMSCVFTARQYSVEQTLQACQSLGLKYIDWITTMGLSPEELKQRTEDAGIRICAYTFFLHKIPAGKQRIDALKKELDNASVLGVNVTMLPTWPVPGQKREDAFQEWLPVIQAYTQSAKEHGLIASIENFPRHNSPMVTGADFRRFRKECPGLKLTFDAGNCAGGEDEVSALDAGYDDIVHVHLKDFRFSGTSEGDKSGWAPTLDGRWMYPCVIGEGNVRIAECLQVLEKKHYQGYMNLEYEGTELDPFIGVRTAIENIRKWTAAEKL